MRLFRGLILLALVVMTLVEPGRSQDQEVVVGETSFPERKWGRQTISFEVTNNTDWLKYLIVEADISFKGSFLNPRRVRYSNFVVGPGGTMTIKPEIEIPANYGEMKFWLRIHDVVDTLDDISLGRVVFEQPFKVDFPVPESAVPYLQHRLTAPPMMDNSPHLDNEFARLYLWLLGEGKTIDEITEIVNADREYVVLVGRRLGQLRYIVKSDKSAAVYDPNFPLIGVEEATEVRKLVDQTADKLADQFEDNLVPYRATLDSLIAAGVLNPDSTNFFAGGSALFLKYPFILGLVVWDHLGRSFINQGDQVIVYASSTPCEPSVGSYMYLTQGDGYHNGNHYYNAVSTARTTMFHIGDTVPEVDCIRTFRGLTNVEDHGKAWSWDPKLEPQSFLVDTTFTSAAVNSMSKGCGQILTSVRTEFERIENKHRSQESNHGSRFWFWNLLATRTMDKLLESGTVTRYGNGQYKFVTKRQ